MNQLSEFEKKTKIIFKDKNLLKQAFIHRSYINENPHTGMGHNERLEFLGDAVLELVVTDFLYRKYSNYTEGKLTALRSALVNAVIISEVASKILSKALKPNSFLVIALPLNIKESLTLSPFSKKVFTFLSLDSKSPSPINGVKRTSFMSCALAFFLDLAFFCCS